MRRIVVLVPLFAFAGCGAPPPSPSTSPFEEGPLATRARAVAEENGVPGDLLLAVAAVEGGLRLPRTRVVTPDDLVPVAGILELRRGRFDSLSRGAALVGADESAIRADTDLGTLAGARVLGELGRQTGAQFDRLATWRAALATLSGLEGRAQSEYLASIDSILRDGGRFPARDGEVVTLAPHPEIGESEIGEIEQSLGGPPPDYAPAIWFSTDCSANGGKCTAGRPDGNAAVNMIVIHDTEGGWNASVATLQFDGGKSVHYIVDADGSRVGQFLHEGDTAWHAGNWCYNKHSIGIEHVGMAADPNGYSDGLYRRSVDLVKDIRTRWKIPLDRQHIVGHYQVPNGNLIPECDPACSAQLDACEKSPDYGGSGNHRDPGEYWQWCQYFQMLGGNCTCNDAWPLWNCTSDHTEAVRCANGKVEIAHCDPCESKPIGQDDVCHAPPPDMAMPERDVDMSTNQVDSSDSAVENDAATAPRDGGGSDERLSSASVTGGCNCALGARRHASNSRYWWIGILPIAAIARRRRRR